MLFFIKNNCFFFSFKDESLKTAFVFGEWYHNYDTFMTYKFLSAGRKTVYVDTVTPENLMKSIQNCQVRKYFFHCRQVPVIVLFIIYILVVTILDITHT